GPELARRTRAMRCENGTLLVRVDHGAWMQELHFIEKKLLDKMRAACPDVELTRIRFTARGVDEARRTQGVVMRSDISNPSPNKPAPPVIPPDNDTGKVEMAQEY